MILEDKAAVVTGAGGGIGQAIAIELARHLHRCCPQESQPRVFHDSRLFTNKQGCANVH